LKESTEKVGDNNNWKSGVVVIVMQRRRGGKRGIRKQKLKGHARRLKVSDIYGRRQRRGGQRERGGGNWGLEIPIGTVSCEKGGEE